MFLVRDDSGRWGHAVAVGPHEIMTASHVATADTLAFCGGTATVVTSDPTDRAPATLWTTTTLDDYVEVGPVAFGPATLVTVHGEYEVEVIDIDFASFTGYRVRPGDSGSPVIQCGRVVGVATRVLYPIADDVPDDLSAMARTVHLAPMH